MYLLKFVEYICPNNFRRAALPLPWLITHTITITDNHALLFITIITVIIIINFKERSLHARNMKWGVVTWKGNKVSSIHFLWSHSRAKLFPPQNFWEKFHKIFQISPCILYFLHFISTHVEYPEHSKEPIHLQLDRSELERSYSCKLSIL